MKPKLPRLSEEQIQEQIVQTLEAVGCTVYHTNTHGVRGKTGVSKGVPDLLVVSPWASRGCFIGIEVKKPKGWQWSSYEQWVAFNRGHTNLAFGPRSALSAIYCSNMCPPMSDPRMRRVQNAIEQLPVEEFDCHTTKRVPAIRAGRRR